MNNLEYKLYHESFMQNNNGTSALDAFVSIVPNFFSSCIAKYVVIILGFNNQFYNLCLEFSFITIPAILVTTILAEYRLAWLLLSMIGFIFLHKKYFNLESFNMKVERRRKWQCISYVRALISLVTAICILAVDFNIFPRYLAKTERYGFSFMDAGVGLFVFSNALVPQKFSRHSLMNSLELNAKPVGILLVLGLSRAFLVHKINYQQHVSEYGVHWNFFITLALTKLMVTVILCIFKENNSLISGLILLFAHELLLQNGLSNWVFSDANRNSFIAANREGLVSCVGYVSLYLISCYVGQVIRDKYKHNTEGDVVKTLMCIILISWIGVYVSSKFLYVSRCLANAGYCSFVIAISTTVLTMFFICEVNEIFYYKGDKRKSDKKIDCALPVMYDAINKNGLLFFLICNMTTGLINLSFNTLLLDPFHGLLIIYSYMVFVVFLIVGFQKKYNAIV